MLLFFLTFTLSLPFIAQAQLISFKTIPVATGDQFLLFPSQNLGMGGVSISLEDSLLDPFINPAKGAWVEKTSFIWSPTYYAISEYNSSAYTMPLGILFNSSQWFSGFSAAIQQLETSRINDMRNNAWIFNWHPGAMVQRLSSDTWSNNFYMFGLLGKRLSNSNTSIASSLFLADLDFIEGVDLLYTDSENINQSGYITDWRVGLQSELGDGRLYEVLLLYNRLRMTHKVIYLDTEWDDVIGEMVEQTLSEKNPDHSDTWGIHTRYVQPLRPGGWRVGGIFTINWITHPEIPKYSIVAVPEPQEIPKDPGDSWAYNIGIGTSENIGKAVYGMDFIYEPIWCHSWAYEDTSVVTVEGKIIPVGSKTIDNHFKFSNSVWRIGIKREEKNIGFHLGVQMRRIHYRLEQINLINDISRDQREQWKEWTYSWSLILKFPEFHIRYLGRMTTGSGQPGEAGSFWNERRWGFQDAQLFGSKGSFILPPGNSLTLDEVTIRTHQITFTFPFR